MMGKAREVNESLIHWDRSDEVKPAEFHPGMKYCLCW